MPVRCVDGTYERPQLLTLDVINASRYACVAIRSFRDKDTEATWHRVYVKKLSPELSKAAYNKLVLINAATNINDLRVPPGNRLEKLVGKRAGQHSIRVNDQWRICFTWVGSDNEDVELTDYPLRRRNRWQTLRPPIRARS